MTLLERSYYEDPNILQRVWESVKMVLRSTDIPVEYVRAQVESTRRQARLGEIETYCFFVGYPRSGHSLVGALLNAHPDMVISHELDVTRYLKAGFTRDQLYAMILRRDQWFKDEDYQWGAYDYQVPGQWQGRARDLKVTGDKKGGGTTRRLSHDPELLYRLQDTLPESIRPIHVLRNPYDQIASNARNSHSLEPYVDRFFRQARTVQWIKDELEDDVLDVRLEELVADPHHHITRLCRFLDVDPEKEYLAACDKVIFDSPNRRRDTVDWPDAIVDDFQRRADQIDYLAPFSDLRPEDPSP